MLLQLKSLEESTTPNSPQWMNQVIFMIRRQFIIMVTTPYILHVSIINQVQENCLLIQKQVTSMPHSLHQLLEVTRETLNNSLHLLEVIHQALNNSHPRGGGTLGIPGWGCAAGTLEPLSYTRASSA